MKKLTIIAPVHKATDIRVVKKQCLTAVNAGFSVTLFSQGELEQTLQGRIDYHRLQYSSRAKRFLLQPKIFFHALQTKSDIFHIHNPDTIFIGLFLKLCGKTVVYDTHECFKEKIMLRQWIPKGLRVLVASAVDFLERSSSYVFDATIVTQYRQLAYFQNALLIGNAPIYTESSLLDKDSELSIKLVYVGGVSFDRGLVEMLELVNRINELQNAILYIIGPIVNEKNTCDIEYKIRENEFSEYLGELEHKVALEYIQKSHFGLALLQDRADYRFTDPNKIYEYMMSGTIYVASNFEMWRRKLEDNSTGYFVDLNDVNDNLAVELVNLVKAKARYRQAVSRNLNFIKKQYNWEDNEAPKLLELYNKLIVK